MDIQRRRFFRGKSFAKNEGVSLPWLTSLSAFYENCTRCGQCIASCPENIIIKGDGGYPTIDFKRGGCTFCQRCASDCPLPLFHIEKNKKPWHFIAEITRSCLSYQGVSCRSCQDACRHGAITFSLQIGKAAQPAVDNLLCSGCGDCVVPCPAEAITIVDEKNEG